jgi:hypothetical protein
MGRKRARWASRMAALAAPAAVLMLFLSGGTPWGPASPLHLDSEAPNAVAAGAHASPADVAQAGLFPQDSQLPAVVSPRSSSVNWLNITAGLVRGPSARTNASAAYDSQDNLLLLYGGENGTSVLSDTWEFSGGAWILISTSSTPGPRYGAGLAYDPTAHYFVLFGGNTSTGIATRTWLFESGHWTLDSSGGQPKPREFPAFAYDPSAGAVIMFGGIEAGNQSGQVWWLMSNGSWTAQTLGGAGTPAHRAASALFWYQNGTSPGNSGMILFGGYSTDPGTSKLFRDTWIYSNPNGTFGWTELSVNSPPPARSNPAVAYDPSASATLMFGGFGTNGVTLDDAWFYNASGWTAAALGSASHPGSRGGAAMALAPIPGKPNIAYSTPDAPLLMGGGAQGGAEFADSWFVGPLPLSLLAPLVPPTSDVETVAQLSVTIFNQGAPVTVTWTGLPLGCAGNNRTSFTCEPTQVGGETISVTISLGPLSVSSGTSNWTVNALPRIALFTVLPSPSIVGRSTTIQVGVATGSGTAPFTYQYLGLPSGCSSSNLAQFSCSPSSAGSFEIEVIVQDADGQSANALTNLTVTSSGGAGTTPLWEYAAEGLGVLLLVLVIAYIVRNKVRRDRSPGGTVRSWDGPPPPTPSNDTAAPPPSPPPSGTASFAPASSDGADART